MTEKPYLDADFSLENEPGQPLAMNPRKFALWLFIVSIIMIFAALTSAYLVRRAEGNWLQFELPPLLWTTTGILLLSSGTMHWATLAARRNNLISLRVAMLVTTGLGLAFLVGQWYAWVYLVDHRVFFGGSQSNPAGSFLYVLTGLHALHLIAGLVFLGIMLVAVLRYRVHSKATLWLDMCATFWHFLDALWLYLFVFLLYNQ